MAFATHFGKLLKMEKSNQNVYDDVPYLSEPVSGTHPNHLASIATLFGIEPVNVKTCRVLELGCGTGGNIIPLAYSLPAASFVGVDLSKHFTNSIVYFYLV